MTIALDLHSIRCCGVAQSDAWRISVELKATRKQLDIASPGLSYGIPIGQMSTISEMHHSTAVENDYLRDSTALLAIRRIHGN